MKKITSKLLILMMILVMTFGLAACGSGKDDQKDDATSQAQATDNNDGTSGTDTTSSADDSDDETDGTDQAPVTDNDDSSGSASYKTVSDYINADEVKDVFSALEKSLEGSGMSMKISAEDNKLIYTYTYDEIEKTDEMANQLEESVAAQDATFQNTANEIKGYVESDTVTVVIEYLDCNGEEIYSKEYVSE